MLEKINHWLSPPAIPGDEDKTEQARILNAIELSLFATLLISALAVPFITPERERLVVLGIILGLFILNGASRFLLFKSRIGISGMLIAISTWAVDVGVAAFSGGVSSPMMYASVVLAIVFGLLLGSNIGSLLAYLSLLSALALAVLSNYGVRLSLFFHFSPISVWFIIAISLIFSGGAVGYTLRRLDEALKQSRRKVVETASHEEAMLRAMFDNIQDGVVFRAADGLASYRSSTCQQIDGFTNAEWSELRDEDLIHPDDLQIAEKAWADALQDRSASARAEYRLRHRNGSWVWVEALLHNLLDDPDIRSVVFTFRDISERKSAEETLKLSEERYRTLVQVSPDAIFINRNDCITFINQSGLDLLGAKHPDEILGRSPFEIFHPDFHGIILERIRSMLRTNSPVRLIEERLIRLDGSLRDVEVAASPFEDRGATSIQVVVRDVTERKQAQEALRRSEAKFKAVIENSHDGFIFLDKDGYILYRSPSYFRLNGYTDEERLGRSGFDIIHADDFEMFKRSWEESKRSPDTPIGVVYRSRHKNGNWVWVESILNNLLSDPDVQAVVLSSRDVTARKNAEEALIQNEQKYSAIFENSAVPAALTKLPEGVFVDVNQAFQNQYGYGREELIGKSSLEIGMSKREERAETLAALASTDSSINNEKYLFTKSGEERIALINVKKIALDGREFAITTIHDITERKKSERAQAEAYAKMEKLFEFLPVGISVLDREGRIVRQNPALARILQITPGGLARGDHLRRAYIRPDGSPMPADEFASSRVLQGERSALDVETGVVKEDGEIIWANVSAIAVPFSDWSTVIVTSDITERKRSEQALLESEERFRSLIEQSAEGIALTDENGILIEWNQAQAGITGLAREEAVGRPSWEVQLQLTPAEKRANYSRESIRSSMQGIFREGVSPILYKPIEFDIRALNGERRTIVQTSFPVRTGKGYRLGVIARDVTEGKRMEEALRRRDADVLRSALEERQRLARELHDSVGQVLGYVSFQADAARTLYAHGRKSEADSQLARLASIAQDAHADVREYILNLRVAPDMQEPFFEELKKYLDSYIHNYDIQADLEVGAGVSEEMFDVPTRLQVFRIVQEALSNARKHADSKHVRVVFGAEDGQARITVQDDGKGFDPGLIDGDGRHHFGLRFMFERAEQLGGSVRIHSAPGEGTRVLVEIPLKKGEKE